VPRKKKGQQSETPEGRRKMSPRNVPKNTFSPCREKRRSQTLDFISREGASRRQGSQERGVSRKDKRKWEDVAEGEVRISEEW